MMEMRGANSMAVPQRVVFSWVKPLGPGVTQGTAPLPVPAAVLGFEDAAVRHHHPSPCAGSAQGRGQRETPQTDAGLPRSSWRKQSTAAKMPVPYTLGKATWESHSKALGAAALVLP